MGRSGYTCVRWVFCWLNVLLWLCGCALLAAGIWLRVQLPGHATLLPQHGADAGAASLLLAAGAVTFAVAFTGCCGAWTQNRCLLITYFCLVGLLFIAEFLCGSLAFAYQRRVGDAITRELQDGIRLHYRSPEQILAGISDSGNDNGVYSEEAGLEKVWDEIQMKLQCCGVKNYEDWYQINAWPTERRVPESCCIPTSQQTTNSSITLGPSVTSSAQEDPVSGRISGSACGRTHTPAMWYDKGCSEALKRWVVKSVHIVGVVGLVVAFIQLFGLISSMLLFCTVRHKRDAHSYKSYSPHAS